MVVDQISRSPDLSIVFTSGESNGTTGQTTFNKLLINENHVKIPFKCNDYQKSKKKEIIEPLQTTYFGFSFYSSLN
ncbi:unnamed protein product [Rotaria sp. Silwood2]|nr:unnamed protein product [Rotaria sp. Silwood2]CAF4420505.1 unnamed protein product [Rotaria sp. Silwood2]